MAEEDAVVEEVDRRLGVVALEVEEEAAVVASKVVEEEGLDVMTLAEAVEEGDGRKVKAAMNFYVRTC